MNEKFQTFRNKHFDLSEANKFRFDILNYKTDGLIFILTVLVVPFFASVFFAILVELTKLSKSEGQLAVRFIYLISIVVGFFLNVMRNKIGKSKMRYFFIYLFVLGPEIVMFFFSIILGSFAIRGEWNSDVYNGFLLVIIMILTELFIVFTAIFWDKKTWKRILETMKTKWKETLVISICGTVLMFIFVTILIQNLIERSLFGNTTSDNQQNLESILNGNYGKNIQIAYAIILFIFTVLIAPLCEELCMRESFYVNASNRWIGFVGSACFFGFVHYGLSFDFEHMLGYTAAGFFLSGVFLFTKGNVTYTWIIHALNNLVAFVLMLAI